MEKRRPLTATAAPAPNTLRRSTASTSSPRPSPTASAISVAAASKPSPARKPLSGVAASRDDRIATTSSNSSRSSSLASLTSSVASVASRAGTKGPAPLRTTHSSPVVQAAASRTTTRTPGEGPRPAGSRAASSKPPTPATAATTGKRLTSTTRTASERASTTRSPSVSSKGGGEDELPPRTSRELLRTPPPADDADGDDFIEDEGLGMGAPTITVSIVSDGDGVEDDGTEDDNAHGEREPPLPAKNIKKGVVKAVGEGGGSRTSLVREAEVRGSRGTLARGSTASLANGSPRTSVTRVSEAAKGSPRTSVVKSEVAKGSPRSNAKTEIAKGSPRDSVTKATEEAKGSPRTSVVKASEAPPRRSISNLTREPKDGDAAGSRSSLAKPKPAAPLSARKSETADSRTNLTRTGSRPTLVKSDSQSSLAGSTRSRSNLSSTRNAGEATGSRTNLAKPRTGSQANLVKDAAEVRASRSSVVKPATPRASISNLSKEAKSPSTARTTTSQSRGSISNLHREPSPTRSTGSLRNLAVTKPEPAARTTQSVSGPAEARRAAAAARLSASLSRSSSSDRLLPPSRAVGNAVRSKPSSPLSRSSSADEVDDDEGSGGPSDAGSEAGDEEGRVERESVASTAGPPESSGVSSSVRKVIERRDDPGETASEAAASEVAASEVAASEAGVEIEGASAADDDASTVPATEVLSSAGISEALRDAASSVADEEGRDALERDECMKLRAESIEPEAASIVEPAADESQEAVVALDEGVSAVTSPQVVTDVVTTRPLQATVLPFRPERRDAATNSLPTPDVLDGTTQASLPDTASAAVQTDPDAQHRLLVHENAQLRLECQNLREARASLHATHHQAHAHLLSLNLDLSTRCRSLQSDLDELTDRHSLLLSTASDAAHRQRSDADLQRAHWDKTRVALEGQVGHLRALAASLQAEQDALAGALGSILGLATMAPVAAVVLPAVRALVEVVDCVPAVTGVLREVQTMQAALGRRLMAVGASQRELVGAVREVHRKMEGVSLSGAVRLLPDVGASRDAVARLRGLGPALSRLPEVEEEIEELRLERARLGRELGRCRTALRAASETVAERERELEEEVRRGRDGDRAVAALREVERERDALCWVIAKKGWMRGEGEGEEEDGQSAMIVYENGAGSSRRQF
ncbi:hypothetical protein HK101_005756 [Irineochytrium annulatum]|nr:hypothetical protein HK101_005756 [Irineochytrium annulatum]